MKKRIFLRKAHILSLTFYIKCAGNFIGIKQLLRISIMLTERAGDQTSNDIYFSLCRMDYKNPYLKATKHIIDKMEEH